MALNLAKTVIDYLRSNPDKRFTARAIADWVFKNYPEACQKKRERSESVDSDDALVQQLVREIASQRPRLQAKCLELKTTEGRPRKYYYTEQSETEEVAVAESSSQNTNVQNTRLKKHDLYPLLSEYLYTELSVYSKRIDEKRFE